MDVLLQILWILFLAVQVILALYILTPFISLLLYLLVKLFGIRTPFARANKITDKDFSFGIIVTAHEETEFIRPLVDSLSRQQYGGFRVYVVADNCDVSDLLFSDPRVEILRPEPALNSKVRSIHYAIDHFSQAHDAIIIFDSDNLVHPEFMDVMNQHFQKGYRVVQSDFQPKNTDTSFARMDAIGDMINFFIDREVRERVYLSANIWGSGVAFDASLYKDVQYRDLLGGFDKKLQTHLVQQVPRIAFTKDAILFDEKINSGSSLENQRARWIHAYFKYFRESWQIFSRGIRTLNFNLFYFGFVLLRPPLFMVFGLAGLSAIADIFISLPLFYGWLGVFASFLISFFGIVAIKGRDMKYISTLLLMPLFVLRQVAAVLKISRAKKSFMKTAHTELLTIDDVMRTFRK